MSKQENEEQMLTDRLRRGDEAAMEQVFRLFYKRLYFFAFKVTGNPIDSEDIVQEVLLHFWLNIRDKGIVPDNIGGYLFRMTRNKCLNHIERQGRMDELNSTAIQQFYADQQQRAEDIAVREAVYHRIRNEFVHLTSMQVQIMNYLYVEGLSVAETAERLNTTVNNVRNHKMRALDRLKSFVEENIFLFLIFFLNFL